MELSVYRATTAGGGNRLIVRAPLHVAPGRRCRMLPFLWDKVAARTNIALGRSSEIQGEKCPDRATREDTLWREATTSSSLN